MANDTTMNVVDLLQELTSGNGRLQRGLGRLGSTRDSHAFRRKLHTDVEHCLELARRASQALPSSSAASDAVSVQYAKLSRQLAKELKKTRALAKDLAVRERQVIARQRASSNAGNEQQHKTTERDESSLDQPLLQHEYQQQQQQQLEVAVSLEAADRAALQLEENEAEIAQIERDVAELGELFKDVSFLVEQQQEQLDVIEDNITSTAQYTRSGLTEVQKAEQYQRRARSRMCKLLALFIIVLAIAVVVIVSLAH